MKRILEIGVFKPASLRIEVVDVTDVRSAVSEDMAVFAGLAKVTSRIEGRAFSGFYRITRAYLKDQAKWRVVASQRTRVAKPHRRVVNRVSSAAV